jgi:hypothetical protein
VFENMGSKSLLVPGRTRTAFLKLSDCIVSVSATQDLCDVRSGWLFGAWIPEQDTRYIRNSQSLDGWVLKVPSCRSIQLSLRQGESARFAYTPLLANLSDCLPACRVPAPRRAPIDPHFFQSHNPVRSGLCRRLCLLLIFAILIVPGCFHRPLAIQLDFIGQVRVFSER